jgi:FixJ family two-component response regulator
VNPFVSNGNIATQRMGQDVTGDGGLAAAVRTGDSSAFAELNKRRSNERCFTTQTAKLPLSAHSSLSAYKPSLHSAREVCRGLANPKWIVLAIHDPSLRQELSSLLAAQHLRVACFSNAAECLGFLSVESPACLVADMHLPDLGGIELQQKVSVKPNLPMIFVSGPCDPQSIVRAMKAGAIEFLIKPVDTAALAAAIHAALAQHERDQLREAASAELQARYSRLSRREREVLPLIVRGLQNKQAAAELGIAKITLQIHRANVMRKMKAGSLAELVRISMRLRSSLENHARVSA